MNDFSAELKNDWTAQAIEVQALAHRLRRGDFIWRLLLIASLAVAFFGLVAAVWFAWIAVRERDLFHGLAAITMLTAVPPAAIAEFRARRAVLRWHDRTPEGVVRHASQRVEATARLLHIAFINGLVLLALSAVIWICVPFGLIAERIPVALTTGIWIGFGLATLAWVRWRTRLNARERERCLRLSREFAAAASAIV